MKERKMKDSGIPWIGEIPEEWKVIPFKAIFKTSKGLSITKDDLIDKGIPVINYGQIHSKTNKGTGVTKDIIRYVPDDYLFTTANALTEYGDFIFADTSEDLDGCGNCCYIDCENKIFAGYHTVLAKSILQNNNKYCAYLFQTPLWRYQIRSEAKGIKVYSITQRMLNNTLVILPSIKEQEKITSFLDTKCSEIDELIDVEQKMIDELEDYRKATITECVTQGLNPDVLMSKSNLPGVSVIPEHWKVCKLKNVCLDYQDGTHATFLTTSQGEYLLSAKNVHNDGIRISDNERTISSSDYKSIISNGFPKRGDILLCCVGTIGRCCIYNLDKPYAFQRSVTFLRINDNAVNTFIYYLLQSSLLSHQYQLYANASAQSGLYLNQVGNLSIVLPPLPEQQAIADYLDTKCKEIDDLIEVKRQKIETLKQYRQSIIFEAVTGKLNLN